MSDKGNGSNIRGRNGWFRLANIKTFVTTKGATINDGEIIIELTSKATTTRHAPVMMCLNRADAKTLRSCLGAALKEVTRTLTHTWESFVARKSEHAKLAREHEAYHEDETLTGEPFNDYCSECSCSYFCFDDDCDCQCHARETDFGDADED